MANRVFGTVAILAFMLCPSAVRSEDSPLPNNLLGFLKPGMCIGVQSVEGTTQCFVDVYDQEQYEIVRDLPDSGRRQVVKAQQFVDNHPAFQKELDAFMEKLREKSPEADPDRVIVYPFTRTWFGTISAVGNDYVLIDLAGEAKRRRVLAKSAIARIDLDAEPIHLRYVPPTSR